MTIAEVFEPSGDAPKMIDSMYDLLIGARLHFGVAELQHGQQLFVLPIAPSTVVTEEQVLFELAMWLGNNGYSTKQMSDEIHHAMIDII